MEVIVVIIALMFVVGIGMGIDNTSRFGTVKSITKDKFALGLCILAGFLAVLVLFLI